MLRRALLFVPLALLLFCLVPARPGESSAGGEVSAAALLERLPDMLASVPEPPKVTEAQVVEAEEDDPETYIFIRGARAHPPRPVNFGGDGRLSLLRFDSGERVSVRYRNRDGTYSRAGLSKISRIMHCSLTGRETVVSIKLVELLDAIEDRFKAGGVVLLSGYRTPVLNRRLAGAARRSLHMLGWAADIRIPGRGPAEVEAYAAKLRGGGVGYYPDMGFTHLDVGRPRRWVAARRAAPGVPGGTKPVAAEK